VILGRLIRNEQMKIMDRTRTLVMWALLILAVCLLAIGQRLILVSGAPVDMWEFAEGCTHLLFIVQLFTLVVAGDIISSEFSWGTAKLLLIRPVSRTRHPAVQICGGRHLPFGLHGRPPAGFPAVRSGLLPLDGIG